MTDETKAGGIKIAPGSSEQAPFIYFDGVVTYGVNNGAIQIELAANTIMPDGPGTKTDVLITAHLRCSPAAASALRDMIDKALAMLQLPIDTSSQSAKPNYVLMLCHIQKSPLLEFTMAGNFACKDSEVRRE